MVLLWWCHCGGVVVFVSCGVVMAVVVWKWLCDGAGGLVVVV